MIVRGERNHALINESTCLLVGSLEDMSFRMLNADIVNEMANLTSLNLSGNNLRSIPPGLVFPKLRHLNVSDNQLTCMMFLKQFPHLTKLHMDGNPLEVYVILMAFIGKNHKCEMKCEMK